MDSYRRMDNERLKQLKKYIDKISKYKNFITFEFVNVNERKIQRLLIQFCTFI